jgi:outer membrane lipoprotein-sorting protein
LSAVKSYFDPMTRPMPALRPPRSRFMNTFRGRIRRLAGVFALLPLALLLAGAGQMAPNRLIEYGKAERQALNAISEYLNTVHTLKGRFLQIGPSGKVDEGDFYMQRPGRVRFEYRPPNPTLVISDGSAMAVTNLKLNTVDRYPLSMTPLDFLLSDKIDLAKSGQVLSVEIEPGIITLKARTSKNRHVSNISFVFAAPVIELRQWTVIDDQNLPTTVVLNGLVAGAPLPPELFVLPKKTDRRAKTPPHE